MDEIGPNPDAAGAMLSNADADQVQGSEIGCGAQPIIEAGQAAWGRLKTKHTLADWFAVGEALWVGRDEALRRARTNRPIGRRYNVEFGGWLSSTGFSAIDKGARSRLLDLVAHRNEIDTWLATLPLAKQLKLNHPDAVWNAWKKATIEPRKPGSAPRPAADLLGAWSTSTSDERRKFLDAIAPSLFAAFSPRLRAEITQRVLGQHRRTGPLPTTTSEKITCTLQKGLSLLPTSEPEALACLAGIAHLLAGRELTLHDVEVRIVNKASRRRAA